MFNLLNKIYFNGFDIGGAQREVNAYIQPLTTFLLWMIPIVFVAVGIWTGLKHMTLDEREKEQNPIGKKLWKLAVAGVLTELIPVIVKIIGIGS